MDTALFSIDEVHNPHRLAKFLRRMDSENAMGNLKSNLIQCIGSYKGQLEISFLLGIEDFKLYVLPFGYVDNQEEYWTISGKHMVVTNNKGEAIGRLKEVTSFEAFIYEGWTYRPDMNTYWTLEK